MLPVPVLLVRHGNPHVEPDRPGTAWRLSSDGRQAAHQLALHVNSVIRPGVLVASNELKARETAEPLASVSGVEPVIDGRLREAERPWIDGDYRELAARWLAGESHDGWEDRRAVAERVRQGIEDAVRNAAEPVAIVGHGLALSVWLGGQRPDLDVVSWWRDLRFPDAWCLMPDGRLERP